MIVGAQPHAALLRPWWRRRAMPPPPVDDAEAGDAAPLLNPAEGVAHPPMPRWYTPKRLLCLFCLMQYMVYMDRGVRAARRSLGPSPTPPLHFAPKPRDLARALRRAAAAGHRQHRREGRARHGGHAGQWHRRAL